MASGAHYSKRRDLERKDGANSFNRAGSARVVMFRKRMMSKMCAAAILCSDRAALAQAIYKQVDAAGHTFFTDRPAASVISVPYARFLTEERDSVPPRRSANGTRPDVAKAL